MKLERNKIPERIEKTVDVMSLSSHFFRLFVCRRS